MLSLFPEVPPKNSSIFAVVKMIICHLLLVICHRLELPPIHHTTTNEIEIHRDNCQSFDRQVRLDKRDFLVKIVRPSMILAIDHLIELY